VRDALAGVVAVPRVALGVLGWPLGRRGVAEVALDSLDLFPGGLLENSGVRECVQRGLALYGGSDSFLDLRRPLSSSRWSCSPGAWWRSGPGAPASAHLAGRPGLHRHPRPLPAGPHRRWRVRRRGRCTRPPRAPRHRAGCRPGPLPQPSGAGAGGGRPHRLGRLLEQTVCMTLHGRFHHALQSYRRDYPGPTCCCWSLTPTSWRRPAA